MDALQVGFAKCLSPVFVLMLGIAIWGYFDHRRARREWRENADVLTQRWARELEKLRKIDGE